MAKYTSRYYLIDEDFGYHECCAPSKELDKILDAMGDSGLSPTYHCPMCGEFVEIHRYEDEE
jgi:uncharacterized Zn finger protein